MSRLSSLFLPSPPSPSLPSSDDTEIERKRPCLLAPVIGACFCLASATIVPNFPPPIISPVRKGLALIKLRASALQALRKPCHDCAGRLVAARRCSASPSPVVDAEALQQGSGGSLVVASSCPPADRGGPKWAKRHCRCSSNDVHLDTGHVANPANSPKTQSGVELRH